MSDADDPNLPGLPTGGLAQTRTVLLFGSLSPALAQTATQQLLLLAAQGSAPIKLVINAQAGPLTAAEGLFDLIRAFDAPVKTIAAGTVANAAALVYAAPPREQRFSLPHARFSLFQPFEPPPMPGRDAVSAALAAADWLSQQRARLARLFAAQTGQPEELVERDIENRTWLDAAEAQRYGLVGRVVQGLAEV
jgi:ATP-dependent Clp protease protease subunit